MESLVVFKVWCLALLALMVSPMDSKDCKDNRVTTLPDPHPPECQVAQMPLWPYRHPLQHHSTCQDKEEVLEVEVLLSPPSHNKWSSVSLQVGTADNYTQLAEVFLDRHQAYLPDGIKEVLVLYCWRGLGRVVNPWFNTTTPITSLYITLQVGPKWLRVYQDHEGRRQLAAKLTCPKDIRYFPYTKLKVSCAEGKDCGNITIGNSKESHKVLPRNESGLSVKVEPGKVEEGEVVVVVVVEVKVHLHTLPHNKSWAIRFEFQYPDNEYDTGTIIDLIHNPDSVLGQYRLDLVCDLGDSDLWDSTSVDLSKSSNTTLYLYPPRSFIIQAGPDWLSVQETTGGRNPRVELLNCTVPLPNFPHLNMTVGCYGNRGCGRVSYPRIEGFDAEETVLPWWLPNLEKRVMKLLVVVVVLAAILGEALAWVWRRYLNIHLAHHLAPLCRCPPLFCRTPPPSTSRTPSPHGPPVIPMPSMSLLPPQLPVRPSPIPQGRPSSSLLPPQLPVRPSPSLPHVKLQVQPSSSFSDSHVYSDPDDSNTSGSSCDGSSMAGSHLEDLRNEEPLLSDHIWFQPVTAEWQREKCWIFSLPVRNPHPPQINRVITITDPPRKLVPVSSDGNCFFSTISHSLTGSVQYHARVRQMLAKYMKNHQSCLKELSTIENYLLRSRMWVYGVWATEVEIYLTASLLKTPIYVYTLHGRMHQWVRYDPLPSLSKDSRVGRTQSIFIELHNYHFQPVLEV